MARILPVTVPSFYLYGEPPRAIEHDFVHCEALDDRTRAHDWIIQPHAHVDLAQIFVLERGGGMMVAEDRQLRLDGPMVVLVPPATAHGFAWERSAAGWVVTMAHGYFDALVGADAELRTLFGQVRRAALDSEAIAAATGAIAALRRELGWSAPARHAAIQAATLSIAVVAYRALAVDGAPPDVLGPQALLVARLRQRIEQRFRAREPVADYARALGVSTTTLRAACARVAGASPMALLDQRTLLEARRALLFSASGVAEIGFMLGFSDPAYFSRFFSRGAGISPQRYRTEARGRATSPTHT